MIHVCSLARLEETVERVGARRVITLINAGTPMRRPPTVAEVDYLHLAMNDIVEPIAEIVQAREDEVDSGLVVLGEQHSAVDEQELPVELEAGHVSPDIAQSAQRNDPQGVRLELRWGLESVKWHSTTLAARPWDRPEQRRAPLLLPG